MIPKEIENIKKIIGQKSEISEIACEFSGTE